MLKGAAKSVVNAVKDIATNPKKALLAVGAVVLTALCPPAGIAIAAVGVVSGTVKVAGGVANAVSAYKDPDATYDDVMNAAGQIGAGALVAGLSAVGVKNGLKAIPGSNGSAVQGAKVMGKNIATKVGSAKDALKAGGIKGAASSAGEAIKGLPSKTFSTIKKSPGALKAQIQNAPVKSSAVFKTIKGLLGGAKGVVEEMLECPIEREQKEKQGIYA
jgi:hypothetical protein